MKMPVMEPLPQSRLQAIAVRFPLPAFPVVPSLKVSFQIPLYLNRDRNGHETFAK